MAMTTIAHGKEEPFIQGQQTFAYDLFRTMFAPNLVISPYSISASMSLAYVGAKGETSEQIQCILHLPDGVKTTVGRWHALQQELASSCRSLEAVVHDSSVQLAPDYLDNIKQGWNADVFSGDLQHYPEACSRAVNQWVQKGTEGHINALLGPNDLNEQSRLVLLSAIWFQASWLDPFSREETTQAPFTTTSGTAVQVPMMQQLGMCELMEDDEVFVVVRQLKHQERVAEKQLDIRCVIILPKDPGKTEAIGKQLAPGVVNRWLSSLRSSYVQLFLPRFVVRQRYELGPIFQAMGMTVPFSNAADFSAMTGASDMRIQKVVHAAELAIDEAGVVASGATAVIMNMKAVRPPGKAITVRCDHPFFVLIQEAHSGLVLFSAAITDPSISPASPNT